MLWKDDQEGDGEGEHARRHIWSGKAKMINKQEDEGTLNSNRRSRSRSRSHGRLPFSSHKE